MEAVEVTETDGEGNNYTLWKFEVNGQTYKIVPGFADPAILFKALASYKPHKQDIWLHTYEKAGTHWMYEILAILISGELQPCPHTKMDEFLEMYPGRLSLDTPKIMNTHMALEYIPEIVFQQTKSIVVVRNPKSVALSSYYFQKRRAETNYSGNFNGFLMKYNMIGAFGEYSGTWYDYYKSFWEKYKHNKNVLFVFFEDLKKEPIANIRTISEFIGLKRDQTFCAGVAKLTSFEALAKGYSKKQNPINLPLYRKGQIDEWKSKFTVAQNEDFDEEYKRRMKDCSDLSALIKFT